MINGPKDEFDRLMALDDEAFRRELGQEPTESQEPEPPAQAAEPPAPGAPEAGAQPAAGGTGETPAAETASEDDWLASLPEDVQSRIKADRDERDRKAKEYEDRFNALHGKVAPVQRRLSELERQLATQNKQPRSQPANDPPVQQAGQSLDSYFDSDGWKQWADDFPGDAKVLRASLEAQQKAWQDRFTQQEQRLQQLEQRLEQTATAVTSRSADDEITKLEAAHSDWRELNNSEEFWNWFEDWKLTQPKSLRGQYYDPERLMELWNDSDFAIARISEYKASIQPPTQPAPPAAQTPPPQPESTQPAQPPAPNPRMAMSVAPEVRGTSVPPAVSTEGMSESELFDHLWRTIPG